MALPLRAQRHHYLSTIRDLMLRLCHRLIACNIVGRSQAPEKVTVTDLFYLTGMDVDLRRAWAWVALGPERQLDDVAGALKVVEGALDINKAQIHRIFLDGYGILDVKTTYNCWYKLKLLDNAADSRLRLLEENVAADEKMKEITLSTYCC
nr:hypothetical protein [Tanacetum cinerariifolium]